MLRPLVISCTLVLMAFVAISCKPNKGGTSSQNNDPYANFANAVEGDSLFAMLDKGACFGRCPVYKLKIYKSGYTVFDAIKWNKVEGVFYTKLEASTMQSILDSANAIGYFNLKDEYDNNMVTDLPATQTIIHGDGKYKAIRNRYGGPQELKDFETWFHMLFENTNWKAIVVNE